MNANPASAALVLCAALVVVASAGTWLLSIFTREYSWVDRLWSVLPPAYLWIFAASAGAAGQSDPRLILMATLGTLWGIRLTANFARKGGYSPGGEDYRWAVLRQRLGPRRYALFNLFFISIYQNVLLLLIALPAWTVLGHPGVPLGPGDLLTAALFLVFLIGETVADGQQWRFQRARLRLRAQGAADPEFLRDGLFSVSRHPNYFFEIAQWWAMAAFGALAAGSLLQPGTLGAVLLTLLFVGSIVFTESISMSRHPGYAAYRQMVWPLIPWFPKRRHLRVALASDAETADARDGEPPVR